MWRLLGGIWQILAGERLRYGAAITSMVIASALLYIPILIVSAMVDGVLTPVPDGELNAASTALINLFGGPESLLDRLWIPGLLVLAFTALSGVFTYLRGALSSIATERVLKNLRDRVYNQLNHAPLSFFDQQETGDLVQRCTSDIDTLRLFLANHIVEIGRASLLLLAPLPVMLMIDWRMTIAATALLPVIVIFSLIFFSLIRKTFKTKDEAEGALTTTIQENLTGIRVVRAFAQQGFERDKLAKRNEAHRKLDRKLYDLLSIFWSVSDLLCMLQNASVIFTGLWLISSNRIEPGEFLFFMSAVNLFVWPIRMMGRILTDLGKATVAYGRLQTVLDQEPETEPGKAPLTPPFEPTGAIEFRDVRFIYDKATEPALAGLSFKAEPGKVVAFVGPSGAGKSTVVELLLRLRDPTEGQILLDGHDTRTLDRRWVRSCCSPVLQEPFLYSKSLRANLEVAKNAISDSASRTGVCDDELHEVARVAAVHDSIMSFEHRYDTLVGERGVTLSGGQRQRIAIARALLHRPPILILDDSLSAVDLGTEQEIVNALRDRPDRQTTILIAHRLSTLLHADEIIVLDKGSVIQRGKHEALADEPGLYRDLWRMQTLADESAPITTDAKGG